MSPAQGKSRDAVMAAAFSRLVGRCLLAALGMGTLTAILLGAVVLLLTAT